MYSLKDMRLVAKHFSQNPETDFDDWIKNSFSNEEPLENIKLLVDEWKKCDKLPHPRRIDPSLKKIISSAINNFSLDELLQATKNYIEVFNSDYQMSYIWDIKKFFTQKNAAPDFLDNGVKWLNFNLNNKTRLYRWNMLEDGHYKKEALLSRMKDLVAQFRKITTVTINGDFDEKERLQREKLAVDSALIKNYAAIFATAAQRENVIINSPVKIPTTNRSFTVHFDHVVEYVVGNEKPVAKYVFKDVFDSLGLK